MSKRQIRQMFRLMAAGEAVQLTSPMASVKKLARLAFIAQQFGYEYADVRQGGGRNNALTMLIVPDPGPQAQARAAQNWAQYPRAGDGVSLPPVVPDALELLKARINFDLTGKNAEKRMVYAAVGLTVGCVVLGVRAGGDSAAYTVAGIVWAVLMVVLGVGLVVTRKRNAKFAALLRAAGFAPVTEEGGRVRYLPPTAGYGAVQGAAGPYGPYTPQAPYAGQSGSAPYAGKPGGGAPYAGQPGSAPYTDQPGSAPYAGKPGAGAPYAGQPGSAPYAGQPGSAPYAGQPGSAPHVGQPGGAYAGPAQGQVHPPAQAPAQPQDQPPIPAPGPYASPAPGPYGPQASYSAQPGAAPFVQPGAGPSSRPSPVPQQPQHPQHPQHPQQPQGHQPHPQHPQGHQPHPEQPLYPNPDPHQSPSPSQPQRPAE
ncbi:hypothetical protein ABZZ47_03560 [Streptomyces sp. NPDC006465]|uniref:hypothetical protein n=1 Tax=Streptomyces sp. NPDC006465 TaxID=3157174 RepID=UPI0033A6F3AB